MLIDRKFSHFLINPTVSNDTNLVSKISRTQHMSKTTMAIACEPPMVVDSMPSIILLFDLLDRALRVVPIFHEAAQQR